MSLALRSSLDLAFATITVYLWDRLLTSTVKYLLPSFVKGIGSAVSADMFCRRSEYTAGEALVWGDYACFSIWHGVHVVGEL